MSRDAGPATCTVYSTARISGSDTLQVIRHASGDARLMNPTAFVECHPHCQRDVAGQPLLANGMGWKPHLYLMIISAKLLAATESLLQVRSTDGANVIMPELYLID